MLNEVLPAKHERNNPHDRYAIAAFKRRLAGLTRETVVAHLPREISRATYYIIIHGGVVTAKVADVNHRRSPLIQGGLEIPVMVSVVMHYTNENKRAIDAYETWVNKRYKEPVAKEYEDATTAILEGIKLDTEESEKDSASSTSFIMKSLAQHLHLQCRCQSLKVGSIDNSATQLCSQGMVDLNIVNGHGKTLAVEAVVLPKVTTNLPSCPVPIQSQMEAFVKRPSG